MDSFINKVERFLKLLARGGLIIAPIKQALSMSYMRRRGSFMVIEAMWPFCALEIRLKPLWASHSGSENPVYAQMQNEHGQ